MERSLRLALIVCALCLPKCAVGAINFSVSFNDPNGDLTAAAALIELHVVAAGERWAGHLVGNANIEVVVRTNTAIPRAVGSSLTSSFVRNNGTYNVFEQGMAAEIRTGVDPNGATADVEIGLNPTYVYGELWFDPDPYARVATVDINRTDAMSTFLHEFGHALGYNGWIDGTNGAFPGDYQSTFDEQLRFENDNFYFDGPEAMALYGAPVPVTFGNPSHVANFGPRPGEDLLLDLMNGLVFYRGSRYDVEPLNIAILRDAGVPAVYFAGDYDTDGEVDAADYQVWKNAYGSSANPYVDGNRNGVVDAADYTVWRDQLGASIFGGGDEAASAVPEPASGLLAMGLLLACCGRQRVPSIVR